MTVKENTFEGQTSGTALTAGNSGGGSGTAFDTVSLTAGGTAAFSNAQVQSGHGTNSLVYAAAASGDNVDIRATSFTANQVLAVRAYFRFASVAPSASVYPIQVRTAGGTIIGSLGLSSNGRLYATATSSNTTIAATFVAGAAVTANTWYRVEAIWTINASVQAQSRLQYAFYPGDSGTATWTYDSGNTIDFGTTSAIGQVRFGKNLTTPTWTGSQYMDSVAWEEGRTTFIGIYNPSAPSPADLVYPYSVVDNTDGWTYAGGASDIIDALDDNDVATYIESPALGVSATDIEVLLAPLNDDAGRAMIVTITAAVTAIQAGVDCVCYVYEGATLRATLPFAATTTPTQFNLTMTSVETAAVTDWSNVSLRFSLEP